MSPLGALPGGFFTNSTIHWENGVEATEEISARILADIPADLVEIGHSERRQKFGETDTHVNRKVTRRSAKIFGC